MKDGFLRMSVLLLLLCRLSLASASIDGSLSDFWNGLGYRSNVTAAGAYQDQAAGFYSGGGVFLRNQVNSYQLVSMQMPGFSTGCSGIDAYFGSFSVISSTQALRMIKNILSSSGMYAFDLALTTAVPQLKSVKDYIQKYVGDLNQANIGSCNISQDLVGGLWPKTRASQQQICRDIGSRQGGPFSDWAAARQGCGSGGQFNRVMASGGDRNSEILVNRNLVWHALQQNGLTAHNPTLAEFLMSLSGSIVVRSEGKKTEKTILPSLADSRALIKALLYGGRAPVYVCTDTGKCLSPSLSSVTVSTADGLVSRVSAMIAGLNDAVVHDSGTLSPSTSGFLEMTPIPVLKFITVNLSLGRAVNPAQYSEVIALSLLNQFVSANMQRVRLALAGENTALSPVMAAHMARAERLISAKLDTQYRRLGNVKRLIDGMRADERELAARLSDAAVTGQETR